MLKLARKLLAKTTFLSLVFMGAVGFVFNLAMAEDYGIGRQALPQEIAKWDIDVRPDGQGLPVGGSNANEGESVYAERCAFCHGDFAEGIDRWPVLAGGHDTLKSARPVKTVGSYWPYTSTLYDYIYRAMPFGEAQTLEPDEVYGVIAYILAMNDVIDDWDMEINQDNLAKIRLPNEANFYHDDRPDIPNLKDGEPCMQNCKDKVAITMRARVLDVTPDDETTSGLAVD